MPYLNRGKNATGSPAYIYWQSPVLPDPAGAFYPVPDPSGVPFGQLSDIVSSFVAAGLGGPAAEAKQAVYVEAAGTFSIAQGVAPVSLADALLGGKVAAGRVDALGTLGVVAAIFVNLVKETSTVDPLTEGGLGGAAATDRPYPVAGFPGQRGVFCRVAKSDGDDVLARELVTAPAPADVDAPVYGYLAFRSDLPANQKWRLWLYYRANSGLETPVVPSAALSGLTLFFPEVFLTSGLPVRSGLRAGGADGQGAPGLLELPGAEANTATVQSTNDTFAVIASYTGLPDGKAAWLTADFVGRRSDGTQVAAYTLKALFKRSGGVVTPVGPSRMVVEVEDDAAWDVDFNVNGTAIEGRAKGGAATGTVDWRCHILAAQTL